LEWERTVIGDADELHADELHADEFDTDDLAADELDADDYGATKRGASDTAVTKRRANTATSTPTAAATTSATGRQRSRKQRSSGSQEPTAPTVARSRSVPFAPPRAEQQTAPLSRRKRRAVDRAVRKAELQRRPFWRGRVIPKTVLGISFTMLISGLAMAASGTLLFMQYRYRQDESDALVRNFPAQVRSAQRAVRNEGENARKRIDQQLAPLEKLAATSQTLTDVVTAAGPSVWAVRTRDADGQAIGGSAFTVASDDEKSFMLTSLAVVTASTVKPGPEIKVVKGDKEFLATLWTWDEVNDLALLVINTPSLPPISWSAPGTARLGDQVFGVSGFGGSGAAILEGRIADVSSDGIQHSTPITGLFRGGPILNTDGRVVAVASRNYSPLGIPTEGFAAPVQNACNQVLRCSDKGVEGAKPQR
jgi:S1-C subfamily serine protease